MILLYRPEHDVAFGEVVIPKSVRSAERIALLVRFVGGNVEIAYRSVAFGVFYLGTAHNVKVVTPYEV